MKKLFVGNLPYTVSGGQIEELFAQVGKVSSCALITDKFSGQSKGFAFVEMENDAEADEAIKKYNGHEMDGRAMVVNVARPKEDRGPGQSFGNRDNNFRGSGSRPKRW